MSKRRRSDRDATLTRICETCSPPASRVVSGGERDRPNYEFNGPRALSHASGTDPGPFANADDPADDGAVGVIVSARGRDGPECLGVVVEMAGVAPEGERDGVEAAVMRWPLPRRSVATETGSRKSSCKARSIPERVSPRGVWVMAASSNSRPFRFSEPGRDAHAAATATAMGRPGPRGGRGWWRPKYGPARRPPRSRRRNTRGSARHAWPRRCPSSRARRRRAGGVAPVHARGDVFQHALDGQSVASIRVGLITPRKVAGQVVSLDPAVTVQHRDE